jgi:hypothetical protein
MKGGFMVALLSIGSQLRRLAGRRVGELDASDRQFVADMMAASDGGLRTSHLADRQVERIERLHTHHVEGITQ